MFRNTFVLPQDIIKTQIFTKVKNNTLGTTLYNLHKKIKQNLYTIQLVSIIRVKPKFIYELGDSQRF